MAELNGTGKKASLDTIKAAVPVLLFTMVFSLIAVSYTHLTLPTIYSV